MNPLANPPYLLPPLVAGVFALLLLLFVASRARRHPDRLLFCFLLFVLGLWAITVFIMRSSPDVEHALPWDRIVVMLMLLSSLILYHFTLTYTQRRRSELVLAATVLYLMLLGGLTPTGLVVDHMELMQYGYSPAFGLAFYPLILLGYLWIAMGVFNLFRAYRASTVYEERNRFLYILVAALFPVVGGTLDIFPFLYPASILGNLAFSLVTAIAISKYHLLDIHVVLRKGIAYSLVSSFILGLYGGLIFVVNLFTPTITSLIVGLGMVFILAVIFQPAFSKIQGVVDRWFYRQRYDHLKALEQFSAGARNVIDLSRLCSTLGETIVPAMQTDTAAILLPVSLQGDLTTFYECGVKNSSPGFILGRKSPLVLWLNRNDKIITQKDLDILPQLQALSAREKKGLDDIGGELFLPLKAGGELTGIVILGPKLSGISYSEEDLKLLRVVTSQAAMSIENARLYALEKERAAELQKVGQMKSDFLLTVSHQLKTPVTSIKASAGILADGLKEERSPLAKRLISSINRGIESLEEHITELLDLARMQNATVELTREPIDLGFLIKEVAALVNPVVQAKKQTLTVNLPHSVPQVSVDRYRFEQILINLLTNASKFTPAGGQVTVGAWQDNTNVVVEVADTGIGIPSDEQELVFQTYYQAKDSKGERVTGSGMGLAIAKALVELHGGKIWVNSQPGEGTKVFFSLPLGVPF